MKWGGLAHWGNSYYISFQIEWDMIVETVFLSILNQMEFYLVQNRKENRHHDHIPFSVNGNENIVFLSESSAAQQPSFSRYHVGLRDG